MLSLIILFILQTPARAEDWFNDTAKGICEGKSKDPECTCRHPADKKDEPHIVINGGSHILKVYDAKVRQEFGDYSSRDCVVEKKQCGHKFSIQNKKVACEEFVRRLQDRQKECSGCLTVDQNSGL